MIKKILSSVIVLLAFFTFAYPQVYATVGGENLVYDFRYNPSDESIYYTYSDGGGRGCPPSLIKISLNSEKNSSVFSCNEGIEMSIDQVRSKIDSLYSNFRRLEALNFKKNRITAKITYIKSETYGDDSKEIMKQHFLASVYQNGKKVKDFPLTGCYIDQPFTLQGYSIPGFNKKILILVSAIRDCAEGGYINEHLEIVGGVDNLDKTSYWFYKGGFPISANIGNMIVYATDNTSSINNTTSDDQISSSTISEKEQLNQADSVPTPTTINEVYKEESFLIKLINLFKNLF